MFRDTLMTVQAFNLESFLHFQRTKDVLFVDMAIKTKTKHTVRVWHWSLCMSKHPFKVVPLLLQAAPPALWP